MPMMDMFYGGTALRMGQAHVCRWTDAILPLCSDAGDRLASPISPHRVPFEQASGA